MSENKTYKLSDDLIAVVRELVQLSLLTGTNIVDHLRAVEVAIDEDGKKFAPTEEYVEAYNTMVQKLVEQASESQKKLDESLAVDETAEFTDKPVESN